MDDRRVGQVREMLEEYLKTPSLRHARDRLMLTNLSKAILKKLDRGSSNWRKWSEHREQVLRMAAPCWVPLDDLREHLSSLAGPELTRTDVAQRMRLMQEEPPYDLFPDDDVRTGCEALYAAERAAGTEFAAILCALHEFKEVELERQRQARSEEWQKQKEEERRALEARFLSGADCKWTPINASKELYCRMNGRAYRLAQARDKRWTVHRIMGVDDPGAMVGTYGNRGDVTKALKELAYKPEPRW